MRPAGTRLKPLPDKDLRENRNNKYQEQLTNDKKCGIMAESWPFDRRGALAPASPGAKGMSDEGQGMKNHDRRIANMKMRSYEHEAVHEAPKDGFLPSSWPRSAFILASFCLRPAFVLPSSCLHPAPILPSSCMRFARETSQNRREKAGKQANPPAFNKRRKNAGRRRHDMHQRHG